MKKKDLIIAFSSLMAFYLSMVMKNASVYSKDMKNEALVDISAAPRNHTLYFSEWKESNDQKYLSIEADNHFWLGVAEGKNLLNQIIYMKQIMQQQSKALKVSYENELLPLAMLYHKFIPLEYKIELI